MPRRRSRSSASKFKGKIPLAIYFVSAWPRTASKRDIGSL